MPSNAQPACHEGHHPCAAAKLAALEDAPMLLSQLGAANRGMAPSDPTDVLHYALELDVDPFAQTIGGTNSVTVRALQDGVSEFRIRLDVALGPLAVTVDGQASAWVRVDPVHVDVSLGAARNAGDEFTVVVDYGGTPQAAGFGSILFTSNSAGPVASTLSETDFAYTWWPVKAHLGNTDKATADLVFTVPDGMSAASNGVLVEDLDPNRWHWRTSQPTAHYLFAFSVGFYNHYGATYVSPDGTMPLEFFLYPGNDSPSNLNALGRIVEMLHVFRPLFGEYPFLTEKYGVYNFPFGGGMEHQTFSGQGGNSFAVEFLSAHELAHQWWGDMVTCETWNHIWLNEGFATYAEALWFQQSDGSGDIARYHLYMGTRRPANAGAASTVFVSDVTNLNRIFNTTYTYQKGAWALHMLRKVVGDAEFFEILGEYRVRFEGSTATTEDFRQVAEDVSGMDLSAFFQQWIYEIGAPQYQSAWRNVSAGGHDFVELQLAQVQPLDEPTFVMPVPVVMTVNGQLVEVGVPNDARFEHFLVPVEAPASVVEVDPAPWILARSHNSTMFVEGPAKIVGVQPIDGGGGLLPSEVSTMSVNFHKDVLITEMDVTLAGPPGAVQVSLEYEAQTFTATITPDSALEAGEWTLAIGESVNDVASSQALDGEVNGSLPSGDGEPGGTAVFEFTVLEDPVFCIGDSNGDLEVNFADITSALANWLTMGPEGDSNGDGVVDFTDITTTLAEWGASCGEPFNRR